MKKIHKNNQLFIIVRYLITRYKLVEANRLNNILYCLSVKYFETYHQLLFEDKFEAWSSGPTIPKVRSLCLTRKYYLLNECKSPTENLKNFIDENLSNLLLLTTKDLTEKNKVNIYWEAAREGLKNETFSKQKIRFRA